MTMARKTVLSNARTTTIIPAQSGPADEDVDLETLEATEDDCDDEDADLDPDPASEEPDDGNAVQDEAGATTVLANDLDEDADTSLVGSIYLHLLGEHNDYDALRLPDDDAIEHHERLHIAHQGELHHPPMDWRFRPARALNASLQGRDTPPGD